LSLPASAGTEADMVQLAGKFPTAALAHFTFDVAAWRDVMSATGRLEHFVKPRTLL